jgi:cytochrome c
MLRTTAAVMLIATAAHAETGDATRGQRVFAATCSACHSLQPGKNMTGPSLADLWNRKAGSLAGFPRYSDAVRSSGITWDDNTLDAWVTAPEHVIAGNQMTFPGIKDPQHRLDLLAFLKQATKPGAAVAQTPQGGMMGGGSVPNLRKLGPEDRVQSVAYCQDTYTVATADGKTRKFWERNIRLKTDSSDEGPTPNAPALVPAGMMGDRADIIFAAPDEIAKFVSKSC